MRKQCVADLGKPDIRTFHLKRSASVFFQQRARGEEKSSVRGSGAGRGAIYSSVSISSTDYG